MAVDPSGVTVAVGPTITVVLSEDVRQEEWCTVQIQNLDATQTFRGFVERRASATAEWALTTIGDFMAIPPAGSVDADGNATDAPMADLDVSGTGYLRITGLMSGAGGNVRVWARKGARKS